jgi:ADP-heptose:LPS heptosyltransferase
LLGVECSVAEIAALISVSDEFIGYDSACQHIAAALGVRTFTIFAGTSNARFIRRWQACGPNLSEIVYVDTVSRESRLDYGEIVERLLDLRAD